ncbi:MAG TPA: hypothetical protein PKH40_07095 [Treponemataceae bacterium]|jgi:hypothetical protein|nr:hypothetical protein [Treponemataceae bacterium]
MKLKAVCITLFLLVVISFPVFSASPVELLGGNLKLVLYPDSGSFALYQLSDRGKNRYEPLFEDRNSSATSWFSVYYNGKIFKLGRKAGKSIDFLQTADSASFVFTLTDDFQVVQTFSFDKNPLSQIPDLLRIRTVIENTSGKEATFALKFLLDTMLGENEGIHFFTDLRNRISAETKFGKDADPDTLIVSRKGNQSLMVYLDSPTGSRPQSVFVSNWARLNTLTWLPEYIEGRSFNSIYSINDSAILFVWPEKKVPANRFLTVTALMGPYYPERLAAVANGGNGSLSVSANALASSIDSVNQSAKAINSGNYTADKESKLVLLEQILERIDQIESYPNLASDEELQQLSQALDILQQQIED